MDLEPTQAGVVVAGVELTSPAAPDVATLTRRMKEGDEVAYRTFYESYYNRLWRYLLVVTAGDEQAAADALQSALLRVVRHIKVFSEEGSFWGWLTARARQKLKLAILEQLKHERGAE